MKKKKSNNSRNLLDTVKNLTKKTGKVEKEKKEKKKRLNSNKPRGYMARRIGSITFWIITSFVLLFILVNIGGKSSDKEEVIAVDSEVTSYSAIEYSRSFLNELFNIPEESDDKIKREEELKKYTINHLEISSAFNSENVVKVDRKNIILKSMTKAEKDEKARHTFSVDLTIEEKFTEEEADEYNALEKDERLAYLEQLKEEDENIVSIKNNIKTLKETLYVVVAIEYNDTGFVIYEKPSFTFLHEEEKDYTNMYAELTALSDSDLTENLTNFLNTFFKAFSSDDKDSLAYILYDQQYSYGLSNTLEFDKIENTDFYEGMDGDYIAKTSVSFINSKTKLKVNADYVLVIRKSDDKHIVTHVNDDEYIYETIYGVSDEDDIEEDDQSNSNDNNSNEDEKEPVDETEEEIEKTFVKIKESIDNNDIKSFRATLSEQFKEDSIKELSEFSIDSDKELEKYKQDIIDGSNDEESVALYKSVEEPEDFVFAMIMDQFSTIIVEDSDSYEFENYTIEHDETEGKYIILFEDGIETEQSESKTIIKLYFVKEDGQIKFDNFDFNGTFSSDQMEFIPNDDNEVIEKKDKENKKDTNKKKSKNNKWTHSINNFI